MIVAALAVLGLCFGSFVNALVWRLHEQTTEKSKKQPRGQYLKNLSVLHGRSMCPQCRHELQAPDLLPVVSWLMLRGKCRYCGRPISAQYPLVELATAALFVVSYLLWPQALGGGQSVLFGLWLVLLVGLMALAVYDLHWKILPDRWMYPLTGVALIFAAVNIALAGNHRLALINTILAVLVGGGLFYVLFQVSGGKWIGGGDVKLGWLLGLVAGTPGRAALFIFLAAGLGTLVSLPLLSTKRLRASSTIPFGPFLIAGAVMVQFVGHDILYWYQHTVLSL